MEQYAEFENSAGTFQADFEEVHVVRMETPNVVKHIPQTLTPEQQAQARKNICAAVAAAVIVTISQGKKASMTSEQIYSHIINGDTVYLLINDVYLPVYVTEETNAYFSIWIDNKHLQIEIDAQANVTECSYACVSHDDLIPYWEVLYKSETTDCKADCIDEDTITTEHYPSTYAVVNYVTGKVGNIETTLDSIIAIQESLIGGAAE